MFYSHIVLLFLVTVCVNGELGVSYNDHGLKMDVRSSIIRQVIAESRSEIRNLTNKLDFNGCRCRTGSKSYDCGCCIDIDFPGFKFTDPTCVNVTYLPEQIGIAFTVTIDGIAVYSKTISVENPPPLCFGVPFLSDYVSVCIDFYDLGYIQQKLHGCIKIQINALVISKDFKIGCFDIPLPGRTGEMTLDEYELHVVKWTKLINELRKDKLLTMSKN